MQFLSTNYIYYKLGLLQLYPPYKNLDPRFLSFSKEGRVLRSKTIFSFPGCFILRVMRPLKFQELDVLMMIFTLGFIKDTNRILTISQILLEIKSLAINTTDRVFETTLELRHMKDVMHLREVCRQLQLVCEVTLPG